MVASTSRQKRINGFFIGASSFRRARRRGPRVQHHATGRQRRGDGPPHGRGAGSAFSILTFGADVRVWLMEGQEDVLVPLL